MVIPQKYISIIGKISITAKENSFDAYVVGGFVRDLFIERESKDLDIMICSKADNKDLQLAGINFSKILASKYNLTKPVVFEKFGTAKLFMDNVEVEFIMPRKEYYDLNSRNPYTKVGSLEQDALRRDFTINALFLRLSDMKILDLTSYGLNDIKNKIIRVTDPFNAKIIFKQDPLRILRAVRQCLQFGFDIEHITYIAMKTSVTRLQIVSKERIRDEINKILVEPNPSKAFIMLDDIRLLSKILPEVVELKKNKESLNEFTCSLKVVDRVKNNIVLRMAGLLYGIVEYEACNNKNYFSENIISGFVKIEIILKRLKYSKKFIQKVLLIIRNSIYIRMYSENWTDIAIRRFIKNCGNEFTLIKELFFAYYIENDANNKKLIELSNRVDYLKSKNMLYIKSELISGEKLMKIFNKPAGKWIQNAKNKIEEIQIEDPSVSVEIVLKMLEKWIS
ncbi:MAG: hypothetical protein LBL77_02455 [Endomicrobium sp.]|jgi:tRNA nucleotidyltransferase/poly(A) polymerase|nr:hypothetical protein [Endomicrobium sp.]